MLRANACVGLDGPGLTAASLRLVQITVRGTALVLGGIALVRKTGVGKHAIRTHVP